jgi:mRNA interferase MazF
MSLPPAHQGDVWFCNLNPIRGHEQAGRRPALVISVDELGTGASGLAIVVPLTRTNRPSPLYVPLQPPEGGLRDLSYAMPEMVRSISRERLLERWGSISPANLSEIVRRVHLLTRVRTNRAG